jgi:hypothetical protein
MKKEEGGYLVVSQENNISLTISISDGTADFSVLYEAMFELLKNHFSFKP